MCGKDTRYSQYLAQMGQNREKIERLYADNGKYIMYNLDYDVSKTNDSGTFCMLDPDIIYENIDKNMIKLVDMKYSSMERRRF